MAAGEGERLYVCSGARDMPQPVPDFSRRQLANGSRSRQAGLREQPAISPRSRQHHRWPAPRPCSTDPALKQVHCPSLSQRSDVEAPSASPTHPVQTGVGAPAPPGRQACDRGGRAGPTSPASPLLVAEHELVTLSSSHGPAPASARRIRSADGRRTQAPSSVGRGLLGLSGRGAPEPVPPGDDVAVNL